MLFGAHAYLASNPVAVAAPLVLQQLAAATGLTASVFVRAGNSRAVVARVEGKDPLRYVLPIGQRLPLHLGAGKVLAAHMDDAEVEQLLDRIGDITHADGRSMTRTEFLAELATVRAQGWAESTDERVVGATSIAAPVVGSDGVCTTAVQIAGPSTSAMFEDIHAVTIEVRQAATALATRLG
ncbi:hypothetical protein GCM10009675_32260 [Prauserella alba]|uniref:IclR-ED domain-containing protein n=2 Tax=Prauserella alba TaxID=176898 RepID=A0ABP4G121_9PSEU